MSLSNDVQRAGGPWGSALDTRVAGPDRQKRLFFWHEQGYERGPTPMTERADSIREAAWFSDRLMAEGQPGAALALVTGALGRTGRPPDARLIVRRARALLALRRDDEARADLVSLLSDVHMDSRAGCAASAMRLLCEIALRAGQLERAGTFLAAALRLDPHHPRACELRRVVGGWRAEARLRAVARELAEAPQGRAQEPPPYITVDVPLVRAA